MTTNISRSIATAVVLAVENEIRGAKIASQVDTKTLASAMLFLIRSKVKISQAGC
jgi:hypothetical protein